MQAEQQRAPANPVSGAMPVGPGAGESLFDSKSITELAQSGLIPSPPTLVSRLVKLLASEDYAVSDVADIVEADASAAARVMSVANSAMYGGSREISSVRDAVNRLGARVTRDVTSSHIMRSAFKPQQAQAMALLKTEWRLSTAVALLLRRAAQADRSLGSPDVAYTLGLFHNVGMPVLICSIDEQARNVDAVVFYKAVGPHAGAVGGMMARKWYLSDEAYRVALRFGRFACGDGGHMAESAALARVAACRAIGADHCMDPAVLGDNTEFSASVERSGERYALLTEVADELLASGQF